jgi:hypothetical protein
VGLTHGARIGPYEVTALIGEGGMGKVWRAPRNASSRGLSASRRISLYFVFFVSFVV